MPFLLANLDVPVLANITSYFTGSQCLIKLLLCGNSVLQHKLRNGGVNTLRLIGDGPTHWDFVTLATLSATERLVAVYMLHKECNAALLESMVLLLPPTLRKLHIEHDSALRTCSESLGPFATEETTQNGTSSPPSIASRFPQLEYLHLDCTPSVFRTDYTYSIMPEKAIMFLRGLPSSLTYLDISTPMNLPVSSFRLLPPRLVHCHLRTGEYPLKNLPASLRSSLRSLTISQPNQKQVRFYVNGLYKDSSYPPVIVPPEDPDYKFFGTFPENLTSLTCYDPIMDFSLLNTNLVRLHYAPKMNNTEIELHTLLARMPKNLTDLYFSGNVSLNDLQMPQEVVDDTASKICSRYLNSAKVEPSPKLRTFEFIICNVLPTQERNYLEPILTTYAPNVTSLAINTPSNFNFAPPRESNIDFLRVLSKSSVTSLRVCLDDLYLSPSPTNGSSLPLISDFKSLTVLRSCLVNNLSENFSFGLLPRSLTEISINAAVSSKTLHLIPTKLNFLELGALTISPETEWRCFMPDVEINYLNTDVNIQNAERGIERWLEKEETRDKLLFAFSPSHRYELSHFSTLEDGTTIPRLVLQYSFKINSIKGTIAIQGRGAKYHQYIPSNIQKLILDAPFSPKSSMPFTYSRFPLLVSLHIPSLLADMSEFVNLQDIVCWLVPKGCKLPSNLKAFRLNRRVTPDLIPKFPPSIEKIWCRDLSEPLPESWMELSRLVSLGVITYRSWKDHPHRRPPHLTHLRVADPYSLATKEDLLSLALPLHTSLVFMNVSDAIVSDTTVFAVQEVIGPHATVESADLGIIEHPLKLAQLCGVERQSITNPSIHASIRQYAAQTFHGKVGLNARELRIFFRKSWLSFAADYLSPSLTSLELDHCVIPSDFVSSLPPSLTRLAIGELDIESPEFEASQAGSIAAKWPPNLTTISLASSFPLSPRSRITLPENLENLILRHQGPFDEHMARKIPRKLVSLMLSTRQILEGSLRALPTSLQRIAFEDSITWDILLKLGPNIKRVTASHFWGELKDLNLFSATRRDIQLVSTASLADEVAHLAPPAVPLDSYVRPIEDTV